MPFPLRKITSIPQLARNANRVREIVTIVSKYGMADWLSRLGLRFAWGVFKGPGGRRLAEISQEARIRLVLTELGPTYIKFGQILSTRPDIVGPALAKELTALQSSTPADPPEVVRTLIERELGKPVKELFVEFNDLPLASASIGQVHRARLKDGTDVVVKVQHDAIERRIKSDLDILHTLAELAEKHVPEVRNYRPRAMTAEFQRILLRELDFRREERNLQQFIGNFGHDKTIRFPQPIPALTSSRVLTMEYLPGTKLSDAKRLLSHGHDLNELARRGAIVFLDMIFRDGIYHADPHPGNILVLDDGVIGLLDCGMVGRLDERMREDLEDLIMAVAHRDGSQLASFVIRLGVLPPDLDEAAFQVDITEILGDYANQPLDQFDLSGALVDMTEVVRKHQIMLPANLSLLIKVLIMLDGTARLLNPQFNLTQLLAPYYQKLFWKRHSPTRQWKKFFRIYQEWEYLGKKLPRGLVGLIQQLQTGRFDVHLEHRHLEPSVNRLAFGILTSSLFLGSAWLWANHVQPEIYDISLPGAIGCFVSVLLGLRLFWAIRRSGRLDH